jgi:fructosamine-3-kinase
MERSIELDPHPILKALGVQETSQAEPLSGGTDTSMWRVQCGETAFALRVFRPDQVKTYDREVVAMNAAASAGLPVPQIHAKGMWQDRPTLLLSWCSGRPPFTRSRHLSSYSKLPMPGSIGPDRMKANSKSG